MSKKLISEAYKQLTRHYTRLDPHAETWNLWIKANKSLSETYEVAIGTVLVQNTNWRNVNNAIANLRRANIFSFKKIQKINLKKLEELVKPAGFYTQKALYLKSLSKIFLTYSNRDDLPSRQDLLACKGIGKETADSILVYCFQKPVPIVGTYTRRFFARLHGDVIYLRMKYEDIQQEINKELETNFEVFGRFHALVVVHGQNLCQKNDPKCTQCFLSEYCMYGKNHLNNPKIAQIQIKIVQSPKSKRNTR